MAGGTALVALDRSVRPSRASVGSAGASTGTTSAPAAVSRFVSRPDLQAPTVTVVRAAPGIGDGLLFLAPNSGPGQSGPLILDGAGEVVWFHPTSPRTAMNFRTATYRGAPVLTWWEGTSHGGLGHGEYVVADASYREVARFPAGRHRGEDQHEFLITPDDTALVTSYETRTANLSRIGGRAKATVIGGVVQELEIPTSRVLYEWRSLDHVAVGESRRPLQNPYDYFHINSIDVAPDGNLLVSARNTWAVYKVSRRSGKVLWRLGGKKSDFSMGRGTAFAWQHDARFHEGEGLVSIFDNGAAPAVEPQSRVVVLRLDHARMTARLDRRYTHAPPLLARAMGNAQLLPNGNYLVGWGTEPYVTEYGPDGAVRFDARLPHGGESYRAFRLPWVGRPSDAPAIAARSGDAGVSVFASWNGATEVAAWQLRIGTGPADLRAVLTSPRRGFETELAVPGRSGLVAVVALDRNGSPLGTSPTLRL